MMMKLVVDQASQKVLGCHVLGPDAGEIVQMAAIAIEMGATKADFDRTVALHPSAAEELVTMRDKWQPPKAMVILSRDRGFSTASNGRRGARLIFGCSPAGV